MRPTRRSLSAAAADVPFRIHYSDGDIRTIRAADPDAARKIGQRPGVLIIKVKRDRREEPR